MKSLKRTTAIINSVKFKHKNKKRIQKFSFFNYFFFEILSATVKIPATPTNPIAVVAPALRNASFFS